MKLSEYLDKIAGKLPAQFRGPLLEHAGALRQLIEEELESARRNPDRAVKAAAARKITATFAALCTTVGVEPIPLADFPILTALQVMMVGAIMHVSGRELSRKAATEFTSALGVNIGAGLALREGARAVIKLLPGFGSAISGAVAGGATWALGRAATAYFIEEQPLPEVRKLFRRRKHAAEAPQPVVPTLPGH